jgi:hypothetical protein
MSKYSGSQYQFPVGGFLPASQNVLSGLGSSAKQANQLAGISQPIQTTNKKGKVTGTRWNPLALQGQLPNYQEAVNQGTSAIDQFTPNAMAAAQQAQTYGLTAADMASGAVPGLFNMGGLTMGQGQGLIGQGQDVLNQQLAQIPGLQNYATQALQAGFDPQSALFNRNAQQMRDVLGASGQAAGVGGSPYGANLQSQGMENFLLDWQNQALQRQQTGAQTAGSLYSTIAGLPSAGQGLMQTGAGLETAGAGLDTTGLDLGQGAAQLANTAGQLPLQMAQSVAQDKLGLQDALTQAKSNMFNQRTGGFNAMNQYLGTVDQFLGTAISGQQQNLNASQAGVTDLIGGAATLLGGGNDISKFMGK